VREHWGGCRSSSSCLMIIGLTAGTAGGTHRLRRSCWVYTTEGDGWLDSSGPQQPGEALGGHRVTSGPRNLTEKNGTGKTGGHYPRSTATAHPPRWSGGFTRTRGRGVVFSEFVFGAQGAHSRGGSATVAFSAISARAKRAATT